MQMKHLLLLASLLTCMGAGAQQATFRNPVIAGDMADPTVIRVDNTYYATGTSSEWAPYYPLFRSKDLVNWRQIGHLFEQQPAWTRSSFWAPELFHRNGKTYAYYTARRKTDGTSYIGVATADKPEGPYTDHGPIVEYGTEAIDAFVLEDAGELYISWKAYGLDPRPIELLACKISDDGLRMAGEPFTLLRDDKRQGMEGQHWLKIGDYYYIVYSINGCCGPGSDYAVAVARSKNLRGPYERYAGNPILHGGGDVQSIGHGTITTTPDGRMFYLCHAYLAGENFFLGRQPMLQQIVLGDDLWLHFQGGETASLTQPMPFAGMSSPYSISQMTSRPTGSDPSGHGTILTRRPRSSLPTGVSFWAGGPKRA
jgi:beta-xylosidase